MPLQISVPIVTVPNMTAHPSTNSAYINPRVCRLRQSIYVSFQLPYKGPTAYESNIGLFRILLLIVIRPILLIFSYLFPGLLVRLAGHYRVSKHVKIKKYLI